MKKMVPYATILHISNMWWKKFKGDFSHDKRNISKEEKRKTKKRKD